MNTLAARPQSKISFVNVTKRVALPWQTTFDILLNLPTHSLPSLRIFVMNKKSLFASAILLATARAVLAQSNPITFPADSGVVSVLDYGAVPNDGKDDTAAIQKAFNENSGSGSMIYLPPGTYHISDTIRWPGRQSFNALQGAGRDHTTLRLIDNAPGFNKANEPKNMIYTGGPPAQRFKNSIRDLTIDSGIGNPGAIGLNFCANNQGGVFDVTIRSGEDGTAPGAVGLGLDVSEVGPLLIKRVSITGFDLGIRVRHTVNSVTLEDITLRGQRVAGIDNFNNYVFARLVISENAVPAVINAGPDGTITLTDSTLTGIGKATELSAIENRDVRATIYLRDVEVAGYQHAVIDQNLPPLAHGKIEEWTSGPRIAAFPGEVRSLRLPIKETPTVPHDPLDQWVSPAKFGGIPGDKNDDTEAIQKAIDSGSTTVYFPRAKWARNSNQAYEISDTIYIRGNVRRLVGLEASFEVTKTLKDQPSKPVFVFEDGKHPVVVMERLRFTFERFSNNALIHRANRDLVISAFSKLEHARHEGKGLMFLEDTVGPELYIGPGSTLYARQLNIEGKEWKAINDGGTLWALGLKTEARSPIIHTKAGGRTEIIGGHLYKCVQQGVDAIAFKIDEGASVSLAGVGEYCWDPKFATLTFIEETRGGETRSLTKHELPPHGNSAVLPLFASIPGTKASSAQLPKPVVRLDAATAASITLAFNSGEGVALPEGGFLVTRGEKALGRHMGRTRESNLTPDKEYTYSVVALDSVGAKSEPATFTARTTPDTEPPSTPGDLKTLYLTDEFVHLRWEESRDEIGVTGYELERQAAHGTKTAPASLGMKREFEDRDVVKGTDYTYRVTALDAAGNRSVAAELKLTVPAHPPQSVRQEAERFDDKEGSVQKGWFISNLHEGCWMLYKNMELGREKPYNQMKIRYGANNDRAGCRIKVLLNPQFEEGGKRKIVGGEEIATLVVEATGGWEKFQEFTLPVKIAKPGKYDVALVIEKGDATEGNALVNIDWFELGFAD